MKGSGKKIVLTIILFCVFSVGLVYLVTATTKEETASAARETQTVTDAEQTENNTSEGTEAVEGSSEQMAAAQTLIGQTVTQDDIEEAVGAWDDFEMSSAGCERGVYAGKFYYKDFYIFSRTYDKGQTFSVTAVNE